MNKRMNILAAMSATALILTGCGGDPSSSSLSMQLTTNGGVAKPVLSGVNSAVGTPLTFTDGYGTTFTITEAKMHVRDVRFDTSNTSVAGDTYEITGPYVMNLMDGTASPSDLVFSAPTGNYQRVDIRIDEAKVDEGIVAAGDALLGNALVIKGTHDHNGGANAGTFTISVKVTEDIRFEPTNGIVVDNDAGANVVLNYSVTDWLEILDTNQTPPAPTGTYVDLTTCIDGNGLIDGANHITITEGTTCGSESIGNLVKENMKNRYDMSS